MPFNYAAHLEELFDLRGSEIACLIMEPAMMNLGIVLPQPGYLQRVRELCSKHGVVFIFDEIKTGFTIAAGGATERFGVQPDLGRLAKAISGGLPAAAFGGRERIPHASDRARRVGDGHLTRQPAGVACGAGDVAGSPDAGCLSRAEGLGTRLAQGCQAAIDRYRIPAHTIDLGAKGPRR